MQKKHTSYITKIVKYSTQDNPDLLKEREFVFEKRTYLSKKLFDILSLEEDLFEIDSISTKREVKLVFYTTNKTPLKEKKEIFYTDNFKTNKEILDYLVENNDLEYINKIELSFILE